MTPLRSMEDLEPLRAEWDALAQHTGAHKPFMSWEWLRACAEQERQRIEPYVVVERDGSSVQAIGPFGRVGRMPGWRRVVFLGGTQSDYQTVLTQPGRPDAATNVWKVLLAQTDWDRIDLYPIAESEAAQVSALAQAHRGLTVAYRAKGNCPVLDLSDGAVERDGQKMLKDAQYQWRRMEKMGVTLQRAETADDLRKLLDGLADLHRRRWAVESQASRFSQDARQMEFERLASVWLEQGVLHATGLSVGGRLIAAHIGACTADRFYWHTPSFDPEFSKYSPGKVLVWRLVEECRARGVRWFDFLRGAEEYKTAWGAVPTAPYGRLTILRAWVANVHLPFIEDRASYFSSRAKWRLAQVLGTASHGGAG